MKHSVYESTLAFLLAGVCFGCGSSGTNVTGGSDGGHHDAGADANSDVGAHPDSGPPADTGGSETAPKGCGVIKTAKGPVEGKASGGSCSYEGIPYAAPPTGSLRWKPPSPAALWTTPRPSAPASGCPQNASEFGTASTDEDCLYLNVWTPSAPFSSPAPVMVFVHGGSFLYGSGTFGLYDGAKLAAATGNIVVTLNYRLGALGFLSLPALRAEDPEISTGVYGILDQIAAFEWVKTNAAAFGGAASNVTVFGESAGGTSMFIHLVSPKSRGLFERVMVESGAAVDGFAALPQASADLEGSDFATSLGCTDAGTLLTCLRGKTAAATLASATAWWPALDGVVIPDQPLKLFAAGSFTKVPTLLGNNKDEGTLFVYQTPPTDPGSYLALEEADFPGHGAAIVAQYPISSYGGSYFKAAADALTDGTFLCPTRTVARAITKSGTPVYRYDFDHAISFPLAPTLGAFHGSELLFVFGNELDGVVSLQTDEVPLSNEMMGYWGSMAARGTPNGPTAKGKGSLIWPKYDLTSEPEIVLDLTLSTETEYKKANCDFWDGLEN
jgi:para-nitrobenzyl esterase